MCVSVFCILLIIAAFIFYFIEQTQNDVYGNRLNGIESVKISSKQKTNMVSIIKSNDKVDKTSVTIKGKIIYVIVYLKDGTRDDAEAIAIKSLEALSNDEKNFYDINFTFDKTNSKDDDSFPIMGYKKSDATIISWTKAVTGAQ
jgi:competence protein ComGF